MPSYEASVILRKMTRPQTAAVLKRTCLTIYNNNGILFGIENLGQRALPYRIKAHGNWNSEGSYFLIKFDSPPKAIDELHQEYARDVDLIRTGFSRTEIPEPVECTLEEELKPPSYRKDVQEMIEKGKKRERKFEFKTGLSYNPFRT